MNLELLVFLVIGSMSALAAICFTSAHCLLEEARAIIKETEREEK